MIRRIALVAFSRSRWWVGASLVIGIAWGVRYWASLEGAAAAPPAKPVAQQAGSNKAAAPQEKKQPIVALVNGQTIMHDEIAQECLRHHGEEVLESLVNRRLVDKYCRERGVSVSQQEIDQEIDRIARMPRLPAQNAKVLRARARTPVTSPHQRISHFYSILCNCLLCGCARCCLPHAPPSRQFVDENWAW